jgi:hypothetical protein
MEQVHTLESVRGDLTKLEQVAREIYATHPTPEGGDVWSLEDYLAAIEELRVAIDRALALPACTHDRYEAEKATRNQIAQRLYYRGRLCLQTEELGHFYKKVGEKGVHWSPTELSRQADRLAAEPLRRIYKATEACM